MLGGLSAASICDYLEAADLSVVAVVLDATTLSLALVSSFHLRPASRRIVCSAIPKDAKVPIYPASFI